MQDRLADRSASRSCIGR